MPKVLRYVQFDSFNIVKQGIWRFIALWCIDAANAYRGSGCRNFDSCMYYNLQVGAMHF